MTRQMREQIECPQCGKYHSNETVFSRWVRQQEDLDSNRDGIVLYDSDMIVHRYKFDHNRLYQCIMLVEVKCHNAEPTPSQKDTLAIFGQFLRNDKTTSRKSRRAQVRDRPTKAFSVMRKRMITCRAFGVHLLTFENTSPENGKIRWDKENVTKGQLIKILKFELHPETLKLMDGRVHHGKVPQLF